MPFSAYKLAVIINCFPQVSSMSTKSGSLQAQTAVIFCLVGGRLKWVYIDYTRTCILSLLIISPHHRLVGSGQKLSDCKHHYESKATVQLISRTLKLSESVWRVVKLGLLISSQEANQS